MNNLEQAEGVALSMFDGLFKMFMNKITSLYNKRKTIKNTFFLLLLIENNIYI